MSKSLLFVADISGFTKFVNETEILHSQHIISELLELLIDANDLGMEVAEVEGDAVLFYRYQSVPGVEEILRQAQKMFIKFHQHLLLYKHQRICQCGACSTAEELSLKFVAHASDFRFVQVKSFNKPHGPDVVLVHKLLKNSIDNHEYVLFTKEMMNAASEDIWIKFPWANLQHGRTNYQDIGDVNYQYVTLMPLHKDVTIPLKTNNPRREKSPVVVEGTINQNPNELFELITNFDLRNQWSSEPIELQYESDRVNRVGTKHTCVFVNGKSAEFETVTNDFGENRLVYGERTNDIPPLKEVTNYFIVEPNENGSHLRMESHIQAKTGLEAIFKPLLKVVIKRKMTKLFKVLKEISESSRFPKLFENTPTPTQPQYA